MWSIYMRNKESDFTKGIFDGEEACRFKKTAPDGYNLSDIISNRSYRPANIDMCLKKAQDLYFEYLEKENKTDYEKGFFEGVKLFLNMNREEYCLRAYAKISPTEFCNTAQLPKDETPQEIVSINQTKPRKRKVSIDWTEEDDKLIYSAVKKYTRDFTSLPAGYNREDVLQEAAQAWVRVLMGKGGHDPAKGKKSTLLYVVVKNTIQDLIKAANTDKREVIQHQTDFNDEYVIDWHGRAISPDNKENTSEQYEGGESKKNNGKGDFEPTKRGVKDSIKWKREQEPDLLQDEKL